MNIRPQPAPDQITAQLRSDLNGRVITPEREDFDEARSTFYGHDRRPAVIARPVDATEVSKVVSLTRQTGAELAIRSGGHSLAGHSVTEGGIVLDLSFMKTLDIDLEGRTAWADSGLTTGEYTAAVGEHGLATGFGDTGSVGIGGITLGGGVGFLVRKHGLTIDSLLAAEVVTADGQILDVDERSHPDLFWAIRGGGGNFGVVTRFKFRLHEVPSIVGGFLVLPATPEVIHSFVGEAAAAPEELSTIANIMKAPPVPFLPPEYHGQTVLFGMLVHSGDTTEGETLLARFRNLAEPIVDMTGLKTYPEMFPPEEQEFEGEVHTRNLFADSIDLDDANRIVAELEASNAAMAVTQIRVLGGAMSRVPNDATAFAHRHEPLMVNVAAVSDDPDASSTHRAWVNALAESLADGNEAVYANFADEESVGRVENAYPGPTWERLIEIKGRYDPDNLFRLNHNIPANHSGF